jgi:hypothetical protein
LPGQARSFGDPESSSLPGRPNILFILTDDQSVDTLAAW